MPNIGLFNCDNMEFMANVPDKFYDLVIADIPYGIEDKISKGGGSHTKSSVKFHQLYSENGKQWDKAVTPAVFAEMQRVAKNQIIFGANYYNMPACRGFIVWDKPEMRIPTMSDCEYAWTSFDSPAKIFRISRSSSENKIHPTSKPIKLYEGIFRKYVKDGDKILDPFLGSASSAIAAHNLGFDFDGCEIDTEYFDKAKKRFNIHASQAKLF